jgi:predicted nucleic acid-binding protein
MALDYLVETNVVLRALTIANPQKAVARQAIKALLKGGADLCIVPQNIVEFWGVCTRPEKDNGLGKTIAATDRYCRFLESFLTVLPEISAIFTEWRTLVVNYQVSGKNVHDARIVAAMNVLGVRRILTFNTSDFIRYNRLEVVHPQSV